MAAAEAEIDVSGVSTSIELHERIATALAFPDYYGRNWDAFDECSRDPDVRIPGVVRILGFQSLERRLPREASLMRRRFSEREAEGGFSVEWRHLRWHAAQQAAETDGRGLQLRERPTPGRVMVEWRAAAA